MRAALYRTDGTIHVEDVADPEPAPGEVRVRVAVSGVNPTDWKERQRPQLADDWDFKVVNQDGAGVIEAVGAGIDPARVGEPVWIYFAAWRRQWGTAAEYCVVPSPQAVRLPARAGFDLGAGLGIPALTAHRCLFAAGPVTDRTVLVAGGAGAVGHAAIELACWAGARVVATASDQRKTELARAAGAHEVVDYRAADAADKIRAFAPNGVDTIVEVDLGHNIDLDTAVVAPDGNVSTYTPIAAAARDRVGALTGRGVTVRQVLVYTMSNVALREAVEGVTAALDDQALTTLPLTRYPLEQAAQAHDAVRKGTVGKVVIDV